MDFRQLYYFSIVAEELNLRRAAERLFMSPPPLSRSIKRLEDHLGLTLFSRHNQGMMLTGEGEKVLEAIRPLLAFYAKTEKKLMEIARKPSARRVIGLTTAFEQGVFASLLSQLTANSSVTIIRDSSPRLARSVRKGKIDAAFVALPLEEDGLFVEPLDYQESLMALLPEAWPQSKLKNLSLKDLNGQNLFWFRREDNPSYYDFTKEIFINAGFAPIFCEEPVEHDVALARIAAGEAMGLWPASFSAIKRNGVVFARFTEEKFLRLHLGVITLLNNTGCIARLVDIAPKAERAL